MKSLAWSVVFGVASVVVMLGGGTIGCGSASSTTPACGNDNTCQASDPVCSRGCGRGRVMLCQCGTGPLAGALVCGTCMADDGGTGNGGGTGGTTGGNASGGRNGGNATGGRGMNATGGRMGRATGGATATGGRVGRATGGANGTGGAPPPSDAGIAMCPANAQAGGVACTPSATPVCETACVNSLRTICTCTVGANVWNCPTTGIPCM